jgi:predicted ribosome quality control (RQC) complex YloA/Tae2 family protein
MLGRRSLNLELLPLDPNIESVFRKEQRATVKMGDNMAGNPHMPENERQRRCVNERPENVDYTRSLRDLFAPVATNSASCIVLAPTNATHFDLKSHVIQLLPSFYGLDHENPYSHVKKFKDICATFKFQNFSKELVHLRLFPFSLHDRAKAWLDSNMPESVTSWENLLNKFYNKFFPMSKVNEYRKEISSFTQKKDEKFSESWERFSRIVHKMPSTWI